MAETDKFLKELSAELGPERFGRNEAWIRSWLEIQAKQQGQTLLCPDCIAFVPLRPDTFDEEGGRICLLCNSKFFTSEIEDENG